MKNYKSHYLLLLANLEDEANLIFSFIFFNFNDIVQDFSNKKSRGKKFVL